MIRALLTRPFSGKSADGKVIVTYNSGDMFTLSPEDFNPLKEAERAESVKEIARSLGVEYDGTAGSAFAVQKEFVKSLNR
jgi:hypothetical protein